MKTFTNTVSLARQNQTYINMINSNKKSVNSKKEKSVNPKEEENLAQNYSSTVLFLSNESHISKPLFPQLCLWI